MTLKKASIHLTTPVTYLLKYFQNFKFLKSKLKGLNWQESPTGKGIR